MDKGRGFHFRKWKSPKLAEQTAKDKEYVKAYLSCSLLSSTRAGLSLPRRQSNDIFSVKKIPAAIAGPAQATRWMVTML